MQANITFKLKTDWPTKIVGIYSPTYGCGKSEVAKCFRAAGFKPVKMATLVKSTLFVFLTGIGIDPDRAYEYLEGGLKQAEIPELGVTGRFLMADYATDWGRVIHPDVWLMAAKKQIREMSPSPNGVRLVVIDDIRFKNEYDWISNYKDGHLIKITRPNGPNPEPEHSDSEGNLTKLDFHYTIVNNKDLRHLRTEAQDVINRIMKTNGDI